jgi:peptidoglycan/xylan/chitin deacetylase (PgdA/CDA1 family)
VRRHLVVFLPVVALAAVLAVATGSGSKRPAIGPAHAAVHRHHTRHSRAGADAVARLPAAPAQVRGAAARSMPIPILMYHVVATPKPGTPNAQLWVPQSTFASEMAALRRAGYWAITLRQAYDGWTRGAPSPRRPIVISFDDGYLGDYTHARPVLRALGWPGVLNLELHNVGPRGLTAHEIRALIATGWEVDSHTVDHPDLTTVDAQRLRYELVASREAIQTRFGVPADFFCYPSGRYDPRVVDAVRAAGYLAATTTNEGYARGSDPFALSRVRVNASDTPATLLATLARERPASGLTLP